MPPSSAELIARRSELSRDLVANRFADRSIAALGLRRMSSLMERLGNPQRRFRVIHIAGSKGKGTTAHIAAGVLSGHGHRTGRYTSPHLRNWNERIAIDDQSIAEADFANVLAEVDKAMARVEAHQPDLGACNAFELLTAAAFVHFADQAVDFAVVEVGLGGRFDSTNVVRAEVAVITRIEREHADILGPELREIAWNKAGIITSSVPVVVTKQDQLVLEVIEAEAANTGATILLESRDWSVEEAGTGLTVRLPSGVLTGLPATLPGAHNTSNLGAALQSVSVTLGIQTLDSDACRTALRSLRIPGRFERWHVGDPPLAWVLDVAHTPESIANLLDAAASDNGLKEPCLMLALLEDKPADQIMAAIAGQIDCLILPELDHPRAIAASDLATIAGRLGIPARTAPGTGAAIEIAQKRGRPVIVTGSFTIVGQVQVALAEIK